MTEKLLRTKHSWGCEAVQNISCIMILTYKQFWDGLSFRYLFITTFSPFFLIPCAPQNMCNVGRWFFGGKGWVSVACWGGFYFAVLLGFFYSCFMFILLKSYMPHSNALHKVKQHRSRQVFRMQLNQLLSEAPEAPINYRRGCTENS